MVAASSVRIAICRSETDIVDRIPTAPFGPIQLTVISRLNISSASLVANPKRLTPVFSFTLKWVYTRTSAPIPGSSDRSVAGIVTSYPTPPHRITASDSVIYSSFP